MSNCATLRVALSAAILAMICGCAPGGDLKLLASSDDDHGHTYQHDYRLGPSDEVRVTTYGEPTLSGEFSVDQGGSVALPLLGPSRRMG